MSDPLQQNSTLRTATTYDVGLRAFFGRVYNTMTAGLVITGLVAWLTVQSGLVVTIASNPILAIIVALAPLGFLFFGFSPKNIWQKSAAQVNLMFYAFSAVFGLSLSYILLAYSGESIARVFFVTAGMFAGTSIYGYTTKRDLTGLGGLLAMGVIGLLIAMVVNIFWHSSTLNFTISVLGVLIYTGLVAWDTQNLKEMYSSSANSEATNKSATMGALSLYINFLNLFMFLLRLMGDRR